MTGETVHGKTNGCTALIADRLRRAMGQGCEPRILKMHSAWGLPYGQPGMHSCALS
jgi:hypothetical protein